jgi:hypothetical protein
VELRYGSAQLRVAISKRRWLRVSQMAAAAWPVLCASLVVIKISGYLAVPWLLILIVIFLPILALACALLAAMWMDRWGEMRSGR